jgi:hypothetical protein
LRPWVAFFPSTLVDLKERRIQQLGIEIATLRLGDLDDRAK